MITSGWDEGEPVSNRRRLASELRLVRDLAGISGRELAQRIGISQSKVSRIESGTAIPSSPEVTAWADAVKAPADTKKLLATLTEAAFTEVHSWRSALQDRTHLQDDIQELEIRARRVLTFQHSVIPGLLQTAEYARRVFMLFEPPYAERDIPAALAARLDRQMALFEEDRKFEFLITEAALRWRPGPRHLLIAQLDRVASLSTLSNVSIGLIPHDVDAVTNTTHGFVLFELGDTEHGDRDVAGVGQDPPATGMAGGGEPGKSRDAIVMVETIHASLTVNDPESVALYRTRWSLLKRMATFGDEARSFLTTVVADIRRSGG